MLKLITRRHVLANSTCKIFIGRKIEVRNTRERFLTLSAPINVRFASTGVGLKEIPLIDKIPEPPPIPDIDSLVDVTQSIQTLAANGEPTFASLGLGGWGPIGLIQNCFEYLHVTLNMPWWGTILLGTVVVRSLTFPLVVLTQRNSAKMNEYLPEIQTMQMKMSNAKSTGNDLQFARYAQELKSFMSEKRLSPARNMIAPIVQAPLFISFFIGLRGMANCPVESMTTGGLWWFTDLTVPDQYYLLPLITSTTMWFAFELGLENAQVTASTMQWMKYVIRAIPFVMLPFSIQFPGAILMYWSLTNFISLGQAGLLRIPAVRDFLKIPKLIKHDPSKLPMKQKGIVNTVKESMEKMRLNRALRELQGTDEMNFTRAGRGPIQKTFKYDPTKSHDH